MIAVGALVVYAIYFFALIKLIPITLTLPGIAGLILTIGVAADANIVIFERVKEEIRARQIGRRRHRHGLQARHRGDHRRERRDVHDGVHPVRPRDRGGQGLRVHAGHRHARLAVHRGARTQAVLGTMGRSRLIAQPGGARRRPSASTRWTLRLHGRVEVVLLDVGRDPARSARWRIGGKGLNFGIDFESGTRIKTALVQAGRRERRARRAGRRRPAATPKIQQRHRQGARAATSSRSRPRRCSPTSVATGPQTRSTQRFGVAKTLLDYDVDRADVRQDGRARARSSRSSPRCW